MKTVDYNILLDFKVNDLLEAFADKVATKVAAKVEEGLAKTTINIRGKGDDELIGTNEACKILGCVPKTMASYRAKKLFRVVMRGPRKALYYRSDIEAFRDANTRPRRNISKLQ